jgi:hypothetical protein
MFSTAFLAWVIAAAFFGDGTGNFYLALCVFVVTVLELSQVVWSMVEFEMGRVAGGERTSMVERGGVFEV